MSEFSLSTALSIWRPAINFNQPNKYDLNETSLKLRNIALIALAGVAFAFATEALFVPLFFLPLMMTPASDLFYNLEKWRATRTLNQLAIAEFKSDNEISPNTMNYATKSAKVIQALAKTPEAFRKVDAKNGFNLAETTYNSLQSLKTSYFRSDQGESEAFKAVLESGISLKSLISKFSLPNFAHDQPDLFIEALKYDVIKPAEFTSNEQFLLWSKGIYRNTIAPLLLEKGFNINVKWNNKGNTPLLAAIANNDIRKVCFLLKHGATFSYEDPIFQKMDMGIDGIGNPFFYEEKDPNESQPLKDFLQDKPTLLRILEQAKNNPKVESPLVKETDTSVFALWKPMIQVKDFNNDTVLRSMLVGLACIYAGAIAIVATTQLVLPALAFSAVVIPTTFLYNAWEKSRSVRALHHLALKEFETSFPSENIYKLIATRPETLNELLKKSPHAPLKAADSGITLWDVVCRQDNLSGFFSYSQKLDSETEFSIFVKLADSIFGDDSPNKLTSNAKFELFIKAIKSNEPRYVSYLLEKGYVKGADFNSEHLLKCWEEIKEPKMISILVNHGWDVNQDHNGITPLLDATKTNKNYDFIKALVQKGAKTNVGIINNENKFVSIADLTSNNAIRSLLLQAR